MPYAHKKTGKNEVTVTKKDSGAVVGHTTPGKLNDYLAALHIHSGDNASQGGVIPDPELIRQPRGEAVEYKRDPNVAPNLKRSKGAVTLVPKGGEYDKALKPKTETKEVGVPFADAMAEGGIVTPYPENKQELEEQQPEEQLYEHDDPEFEAEPHHFADGGFAVKESSSPVAGNPFSMGNLDNFQINEPLPIDYDPAKDMPAVPIKPQTPPKANAPAAMGAPPMDRNTEIERYISGLKNRGAQYGPDQQMALEQNLLNQRNSLGNRLVGGGKDLADAIMMGAARAGNPNWGGQYREQLNQQAQEQMGAMEKAHAGKTEDIRTQLALDSKDPNSPLSHTAQKSYGPMLVGLGIPKKAISSMSADLIADVAAKKVTLAEALARIEQEGGYQQGMLDLQRMSKMADIRNQQMQRQQEAAKSLSGKGVFKSILDMIPGTAGAHAKETLERQLNAGEAQPTGWRYVGVKK